MRGADGLDGADGGGGLSGGSVVMGGDISGPAAGAVVVGIQAEPISATPPTPGQVLRYSGVEWVPSTPALGADFSSTLYADPLGDAGSDGRAPSKPTTLTNALATATSGACIVLGAGVYAGPNSVTTAGLTLASVASNVSSPSASAPVRLTGLTTVTAAGTRFVGIDLEGGLTDTSAAAGNTTLSECSVVGPVTLVAPAATQTLTFSDTGFGTIEITGASLGGAVLVRGTKLGGSITHSGTGTATVTVRDGTLLIGSVALTNAGGSLGVTVIGSQIIGGIARTAGTINGLTLLSSVIGTPAAPGTINATGAAVGTVIISDVIFNRAGSIGLAGTELATLVTDFGGDVRAPTHNGVALTTAGLATEFLARDGLYKSKIFGDWFKPSLRLTPLNTSAAPPGVSYLLHTTDNQVAGIYMITISLLIRGSASNTQLYGDLVVDGVSLGAFNTTTGIANGVAVFGATLTLVWAAGVHTVELTVALGGGAGSVTGVAGFINTWRAL